MIRNFARSYPAECTWLASLSRRRVTGRRIQDENGRRRGGSDGMGRDEFVCRVSPTAEAVAMLDDRGADATLPATQRHHGVEPSLRSSLRGHEDNSVVVPVRPLAGVHAVE